MNQEVKEEEEEEDHIEERMIELTEDLYTFEMKDTFIPVDILLLILSFIDEKELVTRVSRVCKYWHVCTAHDRIWKEMYRRRWPVNKDNEEEEEQIRNRMDKRYQQYQDANTKTHTLYINKNHAHVDKVLKWKTFYKLRHIGERHFKEGRIANVTIYEGPNSDTGMVLKFATDHTNTYMLFGGSGNQLTLFHFVPNDEKDLKTALPHLAAIWKKKQPKHVKTTKIPRIKKKSKRFQVRASWIHSFSIHGNMVRGIAFLPNNSYRSISVSQDNTVKVLNLENGHILATYREHPFTWIRALSMTKPTSLCIGSYKKMTKLKWNEKKKSLIPYKQMVTNLHDRAILVIQHDGDYLYSGGEDGFLGRTKLKPFQGQMHLKLHHSYINDIAINEDYVVTTGIDGKMCIRNKDDQLSEHLTLDISKDMNGVPCALAWSKHYLLIGYTSGILIALDPQEQFTTRYKYDLRLPIYQLQCIHDRFIQCSAGCSLVVLDFGASISKKSSNTLCRQMEVNMASGLDHMKHIVPQ